LEPRADLFDVHRFTFLPPVDSVKAGSERASRADTVVRRTWSSATRGCLVSIPYSGVDHPVDAGIS
jgi:hypothetical protein